MGPQCDQHMIMEQGDALDRQVERIGQQFPIVGVQPVVLVDLCAPLEQGLIAPAHVDLAGGQLFGDQKGLAASSDRFNYDYSDAELKEIAGKIKEISRAVPVVHAVLNNNY